MEEKSNKINLSYKQLFLISLAQLGGAAIIYLPGVMEAGRDVWISNIIASIMAYMVIYSHYLPLSLCYGCSMTKTLKQYWGKFLGGLINSYYLLFFFILACLIVSDVYYFGRMVFPETPGFVFIIFFLIPAIYSMKLGLEVIARLMEFLLPTIAFIYILLFLLVIPELDLSKMFPIMGDGIKPVLMGALPNANFPYGQILPVAFLYKYVHNTENNGAKINGKFLKYSFMGIFLATILLTIRSIASVTAFQSHTLIILTFPPFETIRAIEIGDIIERLDIFLVGVFYCTTFFKFIITYYVIGEIICDWSGEGNPADFAIPLAILIGVSMPFLLPRFEVIVEQILPFFLTAFPLFFFIPLLLYITIRLKGYRSDHLLGVED